jgi:exopolysaccharide biosynthesis polyprenyl glycosylphosphotransferase
MFKRFSTNYTALLYLLDLALIQIALQAAMKLRFVLPFGITLDPAWPEGWVHYPSPGLHVTAAVLWSISFLIAAVYSPRKIIFWVDEVQRLFLAHSMATFGLAGMLYLAKNELPRLTFLYFYLLVLVFLLGHRAALRAWYRLKPTNPTTLARILIVGAGRLGQQVAEEFQHREWPAIRLVGFLDDDPQKQETRIAGLPVVGYCNEITRVVPDYAVDEVFVALPPQAHARLNSLVAWLWEQPVRVRVVPDYAGLACYGATIQSLGNITLIGLRDPVISDFDRFIKRLIDVFLSVLGLLLLSPIIVLTAIAIKLDSRGPVFYVATRLGENGQPFKMIKFRSMVDNADKMQLAIVQEDQRGQFLHKTRDDPRITQVGRFIRRTSIDELPQLFNVLKGDMSLVGPRPELPWLADKYQPWQRKRFAVPQGITGWWQINGRGEQPMHLSTEQDLYYIQHYSLWLDLQILWRTVAVVVRGKGAY